jgi:hypothetical protein
MCKTEIVLKAFVRYDGNKLPVAGSLILRKTKPRVGDWKETTPDVCKPFV